MGVIQATTSDKFDLIDREQRIIGCLRTAIELINPHGERNPGRTAELLEFLMEELDQARQAPDR